MATKRSKGVSLDPSDAQRGGGLWPKVPTRCTIKKAQFKLVNYTKKDGTVTKKNQPAMVLTFVEGTGGEKQIEQYSVGNNWEFTDDGYELIPTAGQTGLNDNCKGHHFFRIMRDEAGFKDFDPNISYLEGMEVTVRRMPLPKLEGLEGAQDLSIAAIVEVHDGAAKGKKGRPADDDDEEDDDEDEAPKKKGKGRASDDEDEDDAPPKKSKRASRDEEDDDDEDEPPAKAKKGTAKKAADDDDDDDDEAPAAKKKGASSASRKGGAAKESVDDLAKVAIVDYVTEQGGRVKVADLEDGIFEFVEGHPDRKKIAAWAGDTDNLETEDGWELDGKYVVVEVKGKKKR
jgi:hypothetical protein